MRSMFKFRKKYGKSGLCFSADLPWTKVAYASPILKVVEMAHVFRIKMSAKVAEVYEDIADE